MAIAEVQSPKSKVEGPAFPGYDPKKAWHITQWNRSHETPESRKVGRLSWVAMPNKHDGLGFVELTAQEDREALYGAWCVVVQVSSKGKRDERGWLVRDGRSLTMSQVARMTGFHQEWIERALTFMSRPEVGWAALETWPTPATPGDSPGTTGNHPATPGDSPVMPVSGFPVQTVQGVQVGQGVQTGIKEERARAPGGAAGEKAPPAPSLREQFAALRAQIQELEGREHLTREEREELKKKKRRLSLIQSAQAAGEASVPAEHQDGKNEKNGRAE